MIISFFPRWTGEMLGDIMFLCLRAGEFERAKEVFKKIIQGRGRIVGTPSAESMEMMIDACVQNKETKLAMVPALRLFSNGTDRSETTLIFVFHVLRRWCSTTATITGMLMTRS